MHEESTSKSDTIHVWCSNTDLSWHFDDFFEPVKDDEALNDDGKQWLDEKITVLDRVIFCVEFVIGVWVDVSLKIKLLSSFLDCYDWRSWAQKFFFLVLDKVKDMLNNHLIVALNVNMLGIDIELNSK